MKLQEERRQLNKYHSSFARTDLICEYITEAIKGIKPIQHKLQPKKYSQGNQTGVLLLSDLHYGQLITPDEVAPLDNQFNVKVFERRMWSLAERVIQLVDKERLDTLKIYQLGDELDGDNIFSTQAFSVDEPVVEQLIHYAEFMATWYSQLSQYVQLDIKSAQGNHTRIARKREDALKKNDFARIANHIIGLRIGDFPYIKFNPSTNDYIVDKVFTWNVLGLHGHQIGNIDNVIPQYSSLLRTLFDYVVMGHWHSPEEREVNCSEVIVNGSLVGTNSYSMDRIRQSVYLVKSFLSWIKMRARHYLITSVLTNHPRG
jgi:predicted phosphodiesterase